MITESRFHCWRDSQRLVDAAEIVVPEPKRDGGGMVFNLLRKGICEARKTSYAHPHIEILAFHERRANVLRIGVAHYGFHFASDTRCGTLASLFGRSAENLVQLRVIHFCPERIFDGL